MYLPFLDPGPWSTARVVKGNSWALTCLHSEAPIKEVCVFCMYPTSDVNRGLYGFVYRNVRYNT
jgi:hypothetical protein